MSRLSAEHVHLNLTKYIVRAVLVDGRGWQEPVRAEPGSPVPRLDRACADAQVHGGPGVRVRDGDMDCFLFRISSD